MRLVVGARVFVFATLLAGCQFDREEAARNRREWEAEREHIVHPVAWHASDQPEGLDPPGPTPLVGPRRDPDTIPRQHKPRPIPLDRAQDEWERYHTTNGGLEER